MASKAEKVIQVTGSLVGWFAVIMQLYLIIENRIESIPETVIRFFSFYTILTNILVATCFTVSWLMPTSGAGRFFRRYATVSAITVYIFIVGIVYNLVLRSIWEPQGMQKMVDELLHSIIPVLFIIYWIVFKAKSKLRFASAFPWLLYPLVYVIYILIRGSFSGFFPYPFVDVGKLGYPKVFMNCFYLFLAFLMVSLLVIFIGRAKNFATNPSLSQLN